MHADLKIGDSHVMLGEASDQHPAMPAMMHLYVPNVDAVYQRALAAGGTSAMEPADQFYGDRGGGVKDPSGNHWYIATHIEDVPMAELKKRAEKMYKEPEGQARRSAMESAVPDSLRSSGYKPRGLSDREDVELCETHRFNDDEAMMGSLRSTHPTRYTGKLSCFRPGSSTRLPRSIDSARAMRARVCRGRITSSI